MAPRLAELKRDRPETPFSRLLAQLLVAHDEVLAAIFVDEVGECIDYASRLEPFEAQVIGAQLARTSADVVAAVPRREAGAALLFRCIADRRELLVQRVTEEHCLVVVVEPPPARGAIVRRMARIAHALLAEAGLPAPAWEPHAGDPVQVETRSARGWPYAPSAYTEAGAPRTVVEVIGRYVERPRRHGVETVCFRVRSEARELTLVHVPKENRWVKR